ncbi:beta-ketoacyl-ACP synthase II [Turicibacter bilis]|uniref:3-oxoacyl-[acyl-carrier-protein] synthase 2 n=1 Tax=Turicibacter bilis TaxID=2735723 RepID=A0ABY5JGV4_9FIRM|nr:MULTISPECIES: beta-ketoacyl-ACP synthase II [Turicibacter]MDD5984682.1 beta-ketoacyl-ACP synthase II [Turicibacter sp.]CUO26600.1 3-oxoacyl-[acyl-carrier-protein] synthase 2 [Turicibacter sanguinis]AMC08745.1 3-oxoacyl-ACP synthase [Turicibacter sp. H121]MBS3200919.1 beta-ketoacyl-ACP synthase II [Turicibacter bilis]MBS3203852.1 beta-ketoacyl-ACP synthase II [Turicibacter bilis]
MSKRRVVVTGLGTVCPVGNDVETMWENIKNGVCGIDEITHFDTTDFKVKLAGEIKNLNVEDYINKKEAKRLDRFSQLAMIASKQAYEDARLNPEEIDANRFGVILSSGIGGLETIENEKEKGLKKGYERVSPFFIPMAIGNLAAGNVAIMLGAKGACLDIVTACAAGTNSIGEAFKYVRDGYADIMLTGGAEASITPLGIGGFSSMKALSTATDKNRASIPFDAERNGFVMGEGAGALVLEEYEHAKKRGATIYAEIIGYGVSCDAFHMTAPDAEANGAAACFKMALNDAQISADDIDYINAHGTSTPLNDKLETLGVKKVFGEDTKVMLSSTKGNTGHLLGAAGAVEAIITVKSLQDGFVPGTINYSQPDPECNLDIVPNQGRKQDIQYAMSNSLGFGGHNACIVLKKYAG